MKQKKPRIASKKVAKPRKKATKKKATKKKTTKKKATKKKPAKKAAQPPVVYVERPTKWYKPHLHAKKLQIMAEIPIMPCSAIGKDLQGLRFAHTRAERVFLDYSRACREHGITISLIDCKMSDRKTTISRWNSDTQQEETRTVEASRAVCKFAITDVDSGETDIQCASGLGDNEVWSDTSAVTVAMKQAVLTYFFVAWPQPDTIVQVLRERFEEMDGPTFMQTFKDAVPTHHIIDVRDEILAYMDAILAASQTKP